MKKVVSLLLALIFVLSLTGCAKTCEDCGGNGSIACSECNEGKVKCTKCSGGKISCKQCGGTGHYDCQNCKGKGSVSTNERCDKCIDSKRAGYIYQSAAALMDMYNGTMKDANDSKYWKECGACHGAGYKSITCSECKGTGIGQDCTACNGSGKIMCSDCNGSGLVTCSNCNGKQTITCPTCGGEGKTKGGKAK